MAKPHFSAKTCRKVHRGGYLKCGHKIFIEVENSSSFSHLRKYFSSNGRGEPSRQGGLPPACVLPLPRSPPANPENRVALAKSGWLRTLGCWKHELERSGTDGSSQLQIQEAAVHHEDIDILGSPPVPDRRNTSFVLSVALPA
jgi:hypothetical protein